MKKILIISFYELREYLIDVAKQFEYYLYDIDHYPLFCNMYDNDCKIINCLEHFNEYITTTNPDIILWWFLDVPTIVFETITNNHPNIYYILYNNDLISTNKVSHILKYFNLVITHDLNDIENYNEKYEMIYFNNENKYHNVNIIKKYDLLFVKINNYLDNYEKLKEYAEHNNITYFESVESDNFLFNCSKIIITNDETICEQVLLSGNVLMTEQQFDDLENMKNYILLNDENINEIQQILTNETQMNEIKINGQKKMQKKMWNKFVELVHIQISKNFFDEIFCRDFYDCEYNFEKWMTNKNRLDICYNFKINQNFDYKKFMIDNDIQKVNKYDEKKSYLLWKKQGKSDEYIKTNSLCNNFDKEIMMEEWFNLNNTFNDLQKIETLDDGLKQLHIIQQNNQILDINKHLHNYVVQCEL